MSYGQLVSIESAIELDTSNLDQRLDEMQQTIDGLDGMSDEKVNDLISDSFDSRNLISSDDFDYEDIERRLSDVEGLEDRVSTLEGAEIDTDSVTTLEARIETLEAKFETLADLVGVMHQHNDRIAALETNRSRDASVIDLLRQLARALVG